MGIPNLYPHGNFKLFSTKYFSKLLMLLWTVYSATSKDSRKSALNLHITYNSAKKAKKYNLYIRQLNFNQHLRNM